MESEKENDDEVSEGADGEREKEKEYTRWDSREGERDRARARDKREGTDKRKRGHSGVTLPRVLLCLSLPAATDTRTLVSPRASASERPEVLFISVGLSPSPARTYERTVRAYVPQCARARTHAHGAHTHARARITLNVVT